MPGVDWTRIRADNEIRPTVGSKLAFEMRGAARRDRFGYDVRASHCARKVDLVHCRAANASSSARSSAPRPSASSKSCRRRCASSPAATTACAATAFEELGPVDADGNVIGGSSLATGSFEFEQPLRARWSLAFFVDSGNAFERSEMDAKTSVGMGGRWQSPLGPIRIDLALPLEDDHDEWRVHITLGPDL